MDRSLSNKSSDLLYTRGIWKVRSIVLYLSNWFTNFIVSGISFLNGMAHISRGCYNADTNDVLVYINWNQSQTQEKKYLESRKQSFLWRITRYHEMFLCHPQNMRGWVIPPTSWKVGVVLLGIIFLITELNKPHFLRDEMIFMHCLLPIKQKHKLNRHFSAPIMTQFIVKVLKNEKSLIFDSLPILY